jgi:hypothetical protein
MRRFLPFVSCLVLCLPASMRAAEVTVEIIEGIPDKKTWDVPIPEPTERYTEPAFGLVRVPRKYNDRGLVSDRTNPYLLRAAGTVTLPAGEYRLLLRSRGAMRLFVDGKVVGLTEFLKSNANGHESVPEGPKVIDRNLCLLPVGNQEKIVPLTLDGQPHEFRLEVMVGGQRLRLELGETLIGVSRQGGPWQLLSPGKAVSLSDDAWAAYVQECRARHDARDTAARRTAAEEEAKYWQKRHELARQIHPALTQPDSPDTIDGFIGKKLKENKVQPAPLADDDTFLRRVYLDTVGVIPTPTEIDAFLKDKNPDRRARLIDRLLADPRWADHWVGYWQDVLAENPGILKPTLNNTGPFRWWIHQAFLDNYALDRFATELVLMEGSASGGGPGGFAVASQNDSPMAAKAHILAKAFLGVEMQCARCHDAPFHPFEQKDLFNLAALLNKAPLTLPKTSTVPMQPGGRKPRVTVALKPGEKIEPAWPFADIASAELPAGLLRDPANPREKLAALLTSPRNTRFAEVFVNRLWKRYLGEGFVEPVDDWLDADPSHPELLSYLAHELMTHNYDIQHVARLILNSETYQRAVQPAATASTDPADRLFASPGRRRLSAEQVVDSLFLAVGKEFGSEELCLDPEGRRPVTEMANLGRPRRAWEFTSLSNERDRPALALPMAQSLVDVLTAFGWRDARPNPITVREETATPLQPLVLANGTVGSRIARLSDDSAITELCLQDQPLEKLIDAVFRRVLSRPPTAAERSLFAELLADGYADRRVPGAAKVVRTGASRGAAVSWSNHLSPEATKLKLELERQARLGDPPTQRLKADWRERMEDMLWTLVNAPEFVFVP